MQLLKAKLRKQMLDGADWDKWATGQRAEVTRRLHAGMYKPTEALNNLQAIREVHAEAKSPYWGRLAQNRNDEQHATFNSAVKDYVAAKKKPKLQGY